MALFDQLNRLMSRLVVKDDPDGPSGLSKLVLRVGKCTSIGYYRDNNEDRLFVDEDRFLYIVADGMGGQAAGEQASQLAVDLIPHFLKGLSRFNKNPEEIRQSVHHAVTSTNAAILDKGNSDPSIKNMGTTVVAAVARCGSLFVAHLGDSRAYQIRDGKIDTITTDHSLAQALYQANTITKEELKTHRFRNRLWKYLGSSEAEQGPDIASFELKAGDRIVLATDGLCGVIEDDALLEEVLRFDDAQQCADHLVQFSLDNGSKDNVTVVTVFVDAADARTPSSSIAPTPESSRSASDLQLTQETEIHPPPTHEPPAPHDTSEFSSHMGESEYRTHHDFDGPDSVEEVQA